RPGAGPAAADGRSPTAPLGEGQAGRRAGQRLPARGRGTEVALGVGDDPPVVSQAFLRVVEDAAEGAVRVEVQAGHTDLLDAQAEAGGLDPELQRHAPARLGDAQPGQGLLAIRLEAAEGVGQMQAEAGVDLAGDLLVNPAAVLRRRRVLAEVAQVAAAGDDVGVVNGFQQYRDAGRLVAGVANPSHTHGA